MASVGEQSDGRDFYARQNWRRRIARRFVELIILVAVRLLIKFEVHGREHIPAGGPLIVIANHFSWFEVPLLYFEVPFQMTLFGAAGLKTHWLTRHIVHLFDTIFVMRGQADRQALKRATAALERGGVLFIFPEGGIDPEKTDLVMSGFAESELSNVAASRFNAQLLPARPGTSYLAVRTGTPILPVSFLNTEKVLGNLRRLRRTRVIARFGPVFGPLTIDADIKGRARRELLDEYGHDMMRAIARLLPDENRGPYRVC